MTLAKKTLYLSASLLLAGAMCVAQAAIGESSQDQDSPTSGQAAGAQLRGCLTGSTDNYTLTDHNGSIYHLVGAGSQLQDAVGHEVEISGTPDARRSSAADDEAANTATAFQVIDVRDMGQRCDHQGVSGNSGTMDNNHPMSEQPPNTDKQPKGAPGEGAPPATEPEPHLMALLQQPSTTDTDSASSQNNPTISTPATVGDQSSQTVSTTGTGQATTPPPVTSETPAATQSPTDPNAQMGAGTTTSTQGTAGATATNPNSQMATPDSTGASTSTPGTSTSTATGTGTGATATTTTATAAGATAATPATQQNDQNKPLYERQATDVPWASHSGSTTTTTTTNPNGSSTTTTTTSPQSQSQPQPQAQPHQ